jgi:F-type H+-transporting ATPase subunit alpha
VTFFYLHSRLLERAARLNEQNGGGSMTALPIIETLANDVSAYIPTNVISITDGQIYLDTNLFYGGTRPAISVGLSVSRVGGSAQIKAMKKVAGRLRLQLAQYRDLQSFAQFSSDLDPSTKRQLMRGEKLSELLKQPQYSPIPVEEQVLIVYLGMQGLLDEIDTDKVKDFSDFFIDYVKNNKKDLLEEIQKTKDLSESAEEDIKKLAEEARKEFIA